jgi:hypothetical protein
MSSSAMHSMVSRIFPPSGSSEALLPMSTSVQSPDELEEFEGANTFEGDIENDTNPQGGMDKAEVRNRRRGPPQNDRESGPRRAAQQGKKTHEQQLRILERKPDVPDARQIEEETARTQRDGGGKTAKRGGPIGVSGEPWRSQSGKPA